MYWLLKLWIYEIHIFELRNEEINVKKILAVINATYAVAKRAWKKSGLPGFEPWPLRYRCSALTNWAIKPTGSWSLNWFVICPGKMKLKLWIYEVHIFELQNEEINVKKILAVIHATYAVAKKSLKKKSGLPGFEPWPLRYRCSAPTNWANKPTGSWSLNWCVIYPWKMKMKLWIYEIHIFELRNEEISVKKILAVINATYAVAKRKPEKKNQACRDSNPDLCDTGAAL